MNAIVFSALWGVVLMFVGAFVKNRASVKYIAVAGAVLGLVLSGMELYSGLPLFDIDKSNMLRTGNFSLTFICIVYICTLVLFLLNGKDFEKIGIHTAEYFALIFFVLCGVSLCATFDTLLLLFLGIEIMSIPLYILTGSDKLNLKSNEASLKYFLMGAFSTGLLLMGIAFIYGANSNGSFYLEHIQPGKEHLSVMMTVGIVFLIVALGFKVSAAPFHFWTPDVYDGAPTVITSFMATIVKIGGFIVFIRLFEGSFGAIQKDWQILIVILTVLTLLIGNITAIFQQSVKRMLAYSSIAQAGFMLLAIFALNGPAKEGLLIYSAAYSLATIGIFSILIKLNDYTIDGFNGLARKEPLVAFAGALFLFSLTGIPLTAGFTAKFYVLLAALQNGHYQWLVVVAVLFAATSAYYYFRVIQAMYFKEPAENRVFTDEKIPATFKFMLLVTCALILIIGAYPEIIIGWLYH